MNCGVDPKYVLDDIEEYEVIALLKRIEEDHQEEWEKIRMICYVFVSTQTTKKSLKPTDVMKFPWDKNKQKGDEMSKERYDKIVEKFKNKIKTDSNG